MFRDGALGRPRGPAPRGRARWRSPRSRSSSTSARGRARGHRLDLRSQLRLRADQRGVHDLVPESRPIPSEPRGGAARGAASAKPPPTHTFRTAPAVPGAATTSAPRSRGSGTHRPERTHNREGDPHGPKRPDAAGRRAVRPPPPRCPRTRPRDFVASLPRELSRARPARGRRPLRPPDPALEPAHEAVHLRRAQRHPHPEPRPDRARAARGARVPARDGRRAAARCSSSAPSGRPRRRSRPRPQRSSQFYVNNRWLGGMLTNFRTVKQSIERFKEQLELLEDEEKAGTSSRRRSARASRARSRSTRSRSTASGR